MKALDQKPEPFEKHDQTLDKFFPNNSDKWALVFSGLTMCEALAEEISEAFEHHQISYKAKYAIMQYMSLRKALSAILRNIVTEPSEVIIKHLPEIEWDDQKNWDEKFIFIVKAFYKHLKDEGKI